MEKTLENIEKLLVRTGVTQRETNDFLTPVRRGGSERQVEGVERVQRGVSAASIARVSSMWRGSSIVSAPAAITGYTKPSIVP